MTFLKKTLLKSLFLFSLALLLCSVSGSLSTKEVPIAMQKILDYHIEYKKISPELLQRSFKIYIDHFDSAREYLLESEVQELCQLSPQALEQYMKEYQRGDLSAYKRINLFFEKAVARARSYRNALHAHPDALAWEEKLPHTLDSKLSFAKTEEELKERVRVQMVRYLQWQKKMAAFPYTRLKKALDLYEKRVSAHENSYLFVTEAGKQLPAREEDNLMALRILKCLTASLDAHSTFFTPNEAYHLKVQLEKELYGVGVVLQEGIDGVVVARLIPGGPAQASGLIKPNDILVEIDGKSLENLSFENALSLMRGKEHSTVALGLVRYEMASGEALERKVNVQLKRRKIVMEEDRIKVSHEPYEDGIIGKITLYSFYEGEGGRSSERDLKDALEKLYKQGPLKGLVLDLRSNTGGFLSQAIKVAGLFITNGVVAISKYSDGSLHYYRDLDGYVYFDGPLVILTSKLSASAAEIVAQSLQDYGVGLVVGDKRTYGKGTIQFQTVTDDKSPSFFKVTVGRYYSVSGKSIQIRGVRADIVVPTQLYAVDIGEKYLDYPLKPDTVSPAYDDPLSDVDLLAYPWFMQYYLPTVQKRQVKWQAHLPQLRQQSNRRLTANGAYQDFLRQYQRQNKTMATVDNSEAETDDSVLGDIVMQEAVNVVKDMASVDAPQKVSAK